MWTIRRSAEWKSIVAAGRELIVDDAGYGSGPAGYLPDDLSGLLRCQINVDLDVPQLQCRRTQCVRYA